MLREYTPFLLMIGLAIASAIAMIGLSHLLQVRRQTDIKGMPYESGMTPLGGTRDRFSVQFYLVAMLFIVFDIEVVFMIPWAVSFRELGLFGLVEMLVFALILLVAFVYVWKRGALEWE